MYVYDTTSIIDALSNCPRGKRIIKHNPDGVVTITSITAHELLYGDSKLTYLIPNLTVLPYCVESAQISSKSLLNLEKKGKKPSIPDLLIASTCMANKATLITSDEKFSNVPGLKLKIIT